MNIEEIRDRAPYGASHYYLISGKNAIYYKYDCGELWVLVFKDWMLSAYQDRELKPLY